MLGENLLAGQAFPPAPILLHQPRVQNRFAQRQGLDGLPDAQQRAGIDAADREGQAQRRHFGQTRVTERNVGMTLYLSRSVPFCGAVPE